MPHTKKQIYLKEVLESKFHEALRLQDQNECDLIICLLKDNGISTAQLEHDYKSIFDCYFELIIVEPQFKAEEQ